MTRVTRWFIRAGFVWLTGALLLLLAGSIADAGQIHNLRVVAWHMIALGWITQVIIGVSVWMFPSSGAGRRVRETPRIWIVFWMLNTGLALRIPVEMIVVQSSTVVYDSMAVLSAILQLFAVMLYIMEIWPRVRGKRMVRKRKGQ